MKNDESLYYDISTEEIFSEDDDQNEGTRTRNQDIDFQGNFTLEKEVTPPSFSEYGSQQEQTTALLKPSAGSPQSPSTSTESSSLATSIESTSNNGPSVGLTVVHCREEFNWLDDAPKHWNVKVYEKCGQNVSVVSEPIRNSGSEECSAYLEGIIAEYENLPEINIFLQADALIGSGKAHRKRLIQNHTPFRSLKEVQNAVLQSDAQFLIFGHKPISKNNINQELRRVGWHPRDVFDIFSLPYAPANATVQEQTNTTTRGSACFAVHRDRIRANTIEMYRTLQNHILSSNKHQARSWCWALESTWHAVFGEPYIIPSTSTVDELWSSLLRKSRYHH